MGLTDVLASGSFGIALVIALVGGLMTNLTPCVFPMIPITLRLLARKGEKPLLNALLYGCGIAITYTSLGVLAALGGVMFGSILASAGFNYFLIGLMVILGLTMLGYGNLAALQNMGMKIGNRGSGPWQTLMFGVGAGFVAAPCTDPILAALLTYTAQTAAVTVGVGLLFTYSIGFALPYVILSRYAHNMSKIKVAPQLLVFVKCFFASVMFALAFYYARIPFHEFFVYVTSWIWLAVGAVLLGGFLVWRWVNKGSDKRFAVLPTVILGLGLFAAVQSYTTTHSTLPWVKEDSAELRQLGKPLLIDGYAEWCEACKEVEREVFSDPLVQKELKNWTLLKLDLTQNSPKTRRLIRKYSLMSLPTVILEGPGRMKKRMQGYTDADEFLKALIEFREANYPPAEGQ